MKDNLVVIFIISILKNSYVFTISHISLNKMKQVNQMQIEL
jgi:hypothetical protein